MKADSLSILIIKHAKDFLTSSWFHIGLKMYHPLRPAHLYNQNLLNSFMKNNGAPSQLFQNIRLHCWDNRLATEAGISAITLFFLSLFISGTTRSCNSTCKNCSSRNYFWFLMLFHSCVRQQIFGRPTALPRAWQLGSVFSHVLMIAYSCWGLLCFAARAGLQVPWQRYNIETRTFNKGTFIQCGR